MHAAALSFQLPLGSAVDGRIIALGYVNRFTELAPQDKSAKLGMELCLD